MKITENELITLIEKIVNEQATGVAFGGFGQNMGFSKPTDKYKDLNLEGADIEDGEEEVDEQPAAEEEFNESEIVERLRKRMGPQKFPKKVSEQIINKKPITEENVKITQATMERYMDVKFRELKDQNFVHLQRLTGLIEDNGRNK